MTQLIATLTVFFALHAPAEQANVGQEIVVTTVSGQLITGKLDKRTTADTIVVAITTTSTTLRIPVAVSDVRTIRRQQPQTASNGVSMAELARAAIFGK